MATKWVYLFDELGKAETDVDSDRDKVRFFFGDKGAELTEMTNLDVPRPQGFIITTGACNAYMSSGLCLPECVWESSIGAVRTIEEQAGKVFGGPSDPLLVSCRSGAKYSMPGMTDTVLNIGLTSKSIPGLIEQTGDEWFVLDSYYRLIQMFGQVVMGIGNEHFEAALTRAHYKADADRGLSLAARDLESVIEEFKGIFRQQTATEFPDDPYQQLKLTIEAILTSLNGRPPYNGWCTDLCNDQMAAVTITAMVLGNNGSNRATGVAMSRNGGTDRKKIKPQELPDIRFSGPQAYKHSGITISCFPTVVKKTTDCLIHRTNQLSVGAGLAIASCKFFLDRRGGLPVDLEEVLGTMLAGTMIPPALLLLVCGIMPELIQKLNSQHLYLAIAGIALLWTSLNSIF